MEIKLRVDKHCQNFSKILSKNLTIGLTGSFGSGKSTVLDIFKRIGFDTYSADKEVHNLYLRKEIQEKLKTKIPEAFVTKEKKKKNLDKEKLRKIVFSNKKKLSFLESIIHPVIKKQCVSLIKSNEKNLICEIPILVKSGLEKHFKKIITVEAKQEKRLHRTLKRYKNKLTKEEFLAIEKSQSTEKERSLISDAVIKNNGSLQDLEKKTLEVVSVFCLKEGSSKPG